MFYRPHLDRAYSPADLTGILDDALRVLDRVGMACAEPGAIERLTASRGVRYEGGRLKFPPDVCCATLDIVRRAGAEKEEPPFEAHAPWCCLNYADPVTGQVRPATTAEAVWAARFIDARGGRIWPIPLIPADIDPRHSTLACEYIALTHTRSLGGFMPATDFAEIEFLIEMNQAAGRTFLLDEQIGISPLRFNDHGLRAGLHFAGRKDVNVILVGAMPALGATAPFPLRSALVATTAESLALAVVRELLGFGAGTLGAELFPFDLRFALMTFGSVESIICDLAVSQMYEFLNGRPKRWGHFHSTARQPDAHAAVERSSSVMVQALLGARRFRGAGQLALDAVFSPQQAVIDDEILGHAARFVRGFDPLASGGDAVAEIAAGLELGTYMDQPATAEQFREFCHFPKLFSHCGVGRWLSDGAPTVLADAWRRAQEQAAQCAFHLSEDRQRELDRIYQRALRDVR